jgi:hypothetical protein
VNDFRLELRIGKNIIASTAEVAEKLNSYFTSSADKLVKQKNYIGNYNISQDKKSSCPNTIFIHPVTEEDVESLNKVLKD